LLAFTNVLTLGGWSVRRLARTVTGDVTTGPPRSWRVCECGVKVTRTLVDALCSPLDASGFSFRPAPGNGLPLASFQLFAALKFARSCPCVISHSTRQLAASLAMSPVSGVTGNPTEAKQSRATWLALPPMVPITSW
jgi:hypothetical protein